MAAVDHVEAIGPERQIHDIRGQPNPRLPQIRGDIFPCEHAAKTLFKASFGRDVEHPAFRTAEKVRLALKVEPD
jgi:hypothetical protein